MIARLKLADSAPRDGRQILASFVNLEGKRRWCCVYWQDDCWVAGYSSNRKVTMTLNVPFTHWTELPEHPRRETDG